MLRPPLRAVIALAAVAGLAFADVVSVEPTHGSIGADIVVTGSGFGTHWTRTHAYLTNVESGRRFRLKVIDVHDALAELLVVRGIPGPATVTIRPAGGGAMTSATPIFTLDAPAAAGLNVRYGAAGTSNVVRGESFGTRPGRVYVGGRRAAVTQWTDAGATFVVPAGLPDGPLDVYVSNSVAKSNVLAGAFEQGPSRFGMIYDGWAFTAVGSADPDADGMTGILPLAPAGLSVVAYAYTRAPAGQGNLQAVVDTIQIDAPFDVAGAVYPATIATAQGAVVSYEHAERRYGARGPRGRQIDVHASTYAAADDFQIVITSFDGVHAVGTFDGTLVRASGTLSAETLTVHGSFDLGLIEL